MPTIYTRGPARVEVTERGGGLGPWLILLVLILAASGAAARFLHTAGVLLRRVLEISGTVAGFAVLAFVTYRVTRAVIRARRRRAARELAAVHQPVHVISTVVRPQAAVSPAAQLPGAGAAERAARTGWWSR